MSCKARKSTTHKRSEELSNSDEGGPITPQKRKNSSGPRSKRAKDVGKDIEHCSPMREQMKTRSAVANQFGLLSLKDSPKTCSESDSQPGTDVEKPDDLLFEEDQDGQAIFSFQTPKRRGGMIIRAKEVVESSGKKKSAKSSKVINNTPASISNTPKEKRKPSKVTEVSRTPGRSEVSELQPKTPYALRNRIRKGLVDEVEKQELDRLLEDSGSDFVPSSSSSSSESESESSSSSCVSRSPSPPPPPSPKPHPPVTRKKLKDYVFQSEDYFYRQHAKIATSNNRLSKLKNSKMTPSQLSALLKSVENKHISSYKQLEENVESCFRRWLFAFCEGFNVILYGLGSKSHILEKFRLKHLKDCLVIHIKGYFPDNTLKEVFTAILIDLLEADSAPALPHEILEEIKARLEFLSARIFVLISNLDGKFLQNDKAQTLISQLAKMPKVHFLATIDHINAPLLWDHSKLSAFNFIWEDATTFRSYREETSYEGSLMVQWSGGIALSSLKNVFSSLNTNSRKVFKILLDHHLENNGPRYHGMHFSELYRECRAGFVVSSDLALRTLLTEFMDHQLVKWRKETDHLFITVETPVLTQFKEEIESLN